MTDKSEFERVEKKWHQVCNGKPDPNLNLTVDEVKVIVSTWEDATDHLSNPDWIQYCTDCMNSERDDLVWLK